MAETPLPVAATLDAKVRASGIAIVGVSIPNIADKSTWYVQPSTLQSAAQPVIDAFDISAEETAWQWFTVRKQRDILLYGCDWTQISGAPLDATEAAAWAAYRQALRDVPDDQADPYAIVWPTPPFVINPPPT
jgi:hypothetical protein|tara:strand:- start:167 stop:565 length:399 start_codon:yes stop_codon:yes gene_type:complete